MAGMKFFLGPIRVSGPTSNIINLTGSTNIKFSANLFYLTSNWSHIQNNITTNSGSAVVLSFGSAVTSGNIVCGAVLLDSGNTITSVTDNKGNAYDVIVSHDDGALYTAGFRSHSTITNGPTTITVNTSVVSSDFWVIADEFQPPGGSTSTLTTDGTTSGAAISGTTYPSFNTSDSNTLVYAFVMDNASSTTGAGWNAGGGSGTQRMSEWLIQSTAGSVTPTFVNNGTAWGNAFGVNAG